MINSIHPQITWLWYESHFLALNSDGCAISFSSRRDPYSFDPEFARYLQPRYLTVITRCENSYSLMIQREAREWLEPLLFVSTEPISLRLGSFYDRDCLILDIQPTVEWFRTNIQLLADHESIDHPQFAADLLSCL